MNFKFILVSLFLAFPVISVSSGTPTANELVSEMTEEIQTVARASDKKNYRNKIRQVIDSKYIDSIDFRRMTINAAGGPKTFKKATSDQQETLIDEYSEFLIGMLSVAIYENSNHQIKVLPADKTSENKKKTEVGVILKDPVTGNESDVDFVLHSLDGPWKIYDLKLFETSTLKSNKDEFRSIIKSEGFDGLIDTLKEKNKKNR